ncbi:hypothetical protein [Roseivirga sp. E12]|uniref:hypothetical protein n=1 Tax=Roseivirga sp. E12 TaxID=2819237 RepID=UPI001ABC689A|nr:hypothetical protein [Roseivirga sp. E12]MBO3697272.1 hypothetical protein [Roseivirga sp. E12]
MTEIGLVILVYFFIDNVLFFTFHDGFIGGFDNILERLQISSKWVSNVPYYGNSIFLNSLKNPVVLLVTVFLVHSTIKGWKTQNWRDIEFGELLRPFVIGVCFVLTWSYAFYDFNYYLNQWHLLDRVLIVVLGFLVAWKPSFIPFFIALALLVLSQFSYPFSVSILDKKLLFNMLTLIWAYILLFPRLKLKFTHLVLLILCLHGSNYFFPGLTKLSIGPWFYEWAIQNDLWMHAVYSQSKGWLAFLSPNIANDLLKIMIDWNKLFLGVSLFIELMPLTLLLFNRRWAIICLLSFDLLHIGIFFESGIFFWKWIILNFFIIFLIKGLPGQQASQLFSKKFYAMSLIIICCAFMYFKPVTLGWWDTRANESYSIEVELEDGTTMPLRMNDMAPYDMMFTFARFSFLNPHKVLFQNAHVTQDYELYQALRAVDLEGFKEITKKGFSRFDHDTASEFDQFIQQSFQNLNGQIMEQWSPRSFSAPNHIYTKFFSRDHVFFKFDQRIINVHVRYGQMFYFRGEIDVVKDEIIRTIKIPE